MASILTKIAIAALLCQKSWALRPSQYGPGPGTGSNLPPPTSRANNNANNINAYDHRQHQNHDYAPPPQSQDMDMGIHQEAVEDRLAKWRQEQQYKYEHQSPIDAANPRQEDGKMKLLASVSKGSIAMFFFILMWRAVHHYEMADLAFTGTTRFCMVLPPVILFLGNMAGCVGSLTSNGALGKKRMKGILNLNKLVEVSLMIYNVSRLILVPSKLVPREVFVGRTLSNFLFLLQCQLFTKVTWNSSLLKPASASDINSVYGDTGTGGDYQYSSAGYEYGDGDAGTGTGTGTGTDPEYQQDHAQNNEWR
jgi:hypothetical protein